MPDYALYKLKISTLTPLHIGSGRDLLNEYDYAIHKGHTWRINDSALLDAQQADTVALANQLAQTPPAHLLDDVDFEPSSKYFRYVVKGTPRSGAEGAQLREQLKNAQDQPFLPGSSIKGALRTAIAWQAWDELQLSPDVAKLLPRKEWTGQAYEREIFGRSPNYDLMRALQMSDSQPLGPEALMVLNVRVLNRHGEPSAPVEMEAIRADSTFSCSLKIDHALFSAWAKNTLQGGHWLDDLPAIANKHSRAIIQSDLAWFREAGPKAQRVAAFYEQLHNAALGNQRFLLQLGWGTGWEGKTFGNRLQADENFMQAIIYDYHLTRKNYALGDAFPKSRRAAVSFQRNQDGRILETPALPMGWVLVEMQKEQAWQMI